MLDRSIPFYNTILRCDFYTPGEVTLPEGFSICSYRKDFEKAWAEMECAAGDFDTLEEAEAYFLNAYAKDEFLSEDARFLLNEKGNVIGSCIAWRDRRGEDTVSSLHWLILDEKYHGRGLGRALTTDVMNRFYEQNRMPVYIHTQPWSFKAILLYISMGFRLQKTDSFSHYINQYEMAMKTLKNIVSDDRFALLVSKSDD